MARKLWTIGIGLLLVSASTVVAQAPAVVTTADGNGADATLRGHGEYQRTHNYNDDVLSIRYVPFDVTDGMQKAIWRFDLSGVDLSGKAILDANMVLTLAGKAEQNGLGEGVDRISFWALNDGYVGGANDNLDQDGPYDDLGEEWGQTEVTWDNAPGHLAGGSSASAGVIDSLTAPIGSVDMDFDQVAAGDEATVQGEDLAAALRADTNGLVTVIAAETHHNGNYLPWYNFGNHYDFASAEHASYAAPTLEMEVRWHGDTDRDGDVDLTDFGRLATAYEQPGEYTWAEGDTDFDGSVGLVDFGRLATNYGVGVPPEPESAPEPAGLALLGLGAAWLSRRKRR